MPTRVTQLLLKNSLHYVSRKGRRSPCRKLLILLHIGVHHRHCVDVPCPGRFRTSQLAILLALNVCQLGLSLAVSLAITSPVFDVVAIAVVLALQQVISEQDTVYNHRLPNIPQLSLYPEKRKQKTTDKGKGAERKGHTGRPPASQAGARPAAPEVAPTGRQAEVERQDLASLQDEGLRAETGRAVRYSSAPSYAESSRAPGMAAAGPLRDVETSGVEAEGEAAPHADLGPQSGERDAASV